MTIYNLGNIKGEKGDRGECAPGPTGPQGVGIKSIEQITHKKFKFCLTDGSDYIIDYDTGSFDGMVVACDKSILSAADGEFATVSAQLTSGGFPVPFAGELITFEVRKQSDDSLVETLTDITDDTGKASVEYFGQGVGDLNIKVKCRSLSETYDIEDCINYDNMTSESGKWSFDTGLTPTYSSDGMFLGNVSSGKTAKLDGSYNFPLTFDFDVISITTGSNNSIAFEFKQTHDDDNALFISTGVGIVLNGNTLNTGISQSSYTGHYQLKFTSATNCELYKDNTLITSVNDISVSTLQFMVWLSASRSITIKNIKIKPL